MKSSDSTHEYSRIRPPGSAIFKSIYKRWTWAWIYPNVFLAIAEQSRGLVRHALTELCVRFYQGLLVLTPIQFYRFRGVFRGPTLSQSTMRTLGM